MSFYAEITISGSGSEVANQRLLTYNLDFKRETSNRQGVSSILNVFFLELMLLSDGEMIDGILFKWYAMDWADLRGTIKLFSGDNSSSPVAKEIKFEAAKVYRFNESFDRSGTNPTVIMLGLAADKLEYGGVAVDRRVVENF